MKKPTKAQRHAIYKKALERFNETRDNSLCRQVWYCWGANIETTSPVHMPQYFAELKAQRPKNAGHYWWSNDGNGLNARRRALLRCIKLSAPTKRAK